MERHVPISYRECGRHPADLPSHLPIRGLLGVIGTHMDPPLPPPPLHLPIQGLLGVIGTHVDPSRLTHSDWLAVGEA